MAGLWMNDPATRKGKYPLVVRRDGTRIKTPYMVFLVRDECFEAAALAYADAAERLGWDPRYVRDIREMARTAPEVRARIDAEAGGPGDPDAPRHRTDNAALLALAERDSIVPDPWPWSRVTSELVVRCGGLVSQTGVARPDGSPAPEGVTMMLKSTVGLSVIRVYATVDPQPHATVWYPERDLVSVGPETVTDVYQRLRIPADALVWLVDDHGFAIPWPKDRDFLP